ncbi:cell division control protein 7 [Fonsecaea erecta]|uniref:non-specific serine/threonine protein kinase n=1 Tax=Fonsecaea erecta TaxID=1367422 RepID=A0A178ZG57_9EURO|nr:cell division control protein 7 [Fonsecaea erecta]OAP58622.1 cell division control protein 7 [Fonsecaea erecta]
MKLAKTARGVLKSLRRKQTNLQSIKTSQALSSRYHVLLSDSGVGDTPEKEAESQSAFASTRHRKKARRPAAGIPGKEVRERLEQGNMGQTSIAIHEDAHERFCGGEGEVDNMVQCQAEEDDFLHDSLLEESDESDDDDDDVDESVVDDMRRLEESFRGISQKYRLINRIGEGTFSTVYKAEQLVQAHELDQENEDPTNESSSDAPPSKRRKTSVPSGAVNRPRRKGLIVALKKIYVTSSPHRIMNELELLHELRHSPYICPLLTAFRHHDQVVAVLPYFRHLDFRLYYREFLINDMRHYFRCLLNGLAHVHKAGILHRDIKPTNFLYDHTKRQGVLVDFGLAERQGTDWQPCLCTESRERRRDKFINSYAVQVLQSSPEQMSTGYPKNDSRPSRRANRAGTRGFRAPEVLLKCTSQTTKIDIWSTGVILLTLLARRFPFFNSADDVDAMIEMASIFGRKKMQSVAAMHGQLFETNIETIGERGFTFEKIIIWASCREKEQDTLRPGEAQAVAFLHGLLELDAGKRWSAREALQHEFLTSPVEDEEERAEREAQEAYEEEMRAARR